MCVLHSSTAQLFERAGPLNLWGGGLKFAHMHECVPPLPHLPSRAHVPQCVPPHYVDILLHPTGGFCEEGRAATETTGSSRGAGCAQLRPCSGKM